MEDDDVCIQNNLNSRTISKWEFQLCGSIHRNNPCYFILFPRFTWLMNFQSQFPLEFCPNSPSLTITTTLSYRRCFFLRWFSKRSLTILWSTYMSFRLRRIVWKIFQLLRSMHSNVIVACVYTRFDLRLMRALEIHISRVNYVSFAIIWYTFLYWIKCRVSRESGSSSSRHQWWCRGRQWIRNKRYAHLTRIYSTIYILVIELQTFLV